TVKWYRRQSGKEIAMLKGYTFFLCDSRNKSTDVYTCTVGRKCKARFVVTKDREFLKSCYTVHEHPPPKHIIRNDTIFSTSRSGYPVLTHAGFRYNLATRSDGPAKRWVCARKTSKCRAIAITIDKTVIRLKNEHNHDPKLINTYDKPVYGETKNGIPVLMIGAYRYNMHTSSKGPKVRWYCTRYAYGCRSSVMTYDSVIIRHKADHTH
ncbi:hypothetical protein HF086_014286, partial [Spodoptera exigua]